MKQLKLVLNIALLVTALSWSMRLFACPSEVLIIRHGEKPSKVNGKTPKNLSVIGQTRAAMLPSIFSNYLSLTVIAGKDNSGRPEETCTPVAQSHGQDGGPLVEYSSTQAQAMADYIFQSGNIKTAAVLLCWEHYHIPPLVAALTNNKVNLGTWGDDVYDRILILKFRQAKNNQCEYAGGFSASDDVAEGNITRVLQREVKNKASFVYEKSNSEERSALLSEKPHQKCCSDE